MNIELSHCFLTVDDHEKALVFYRDLLGLEIHDDVSFEGRRWLSVGPPDQPGLDIVLEPPNANPNLSAADQRMIEELTAKGVMGRLVFSVPDCDATFERVRAGGAEVLQEPMDQPYGVRDCAFRDPSGNMVRINQRRKA